MVKSRRGPAKIDEPRKNGRLGALSVVREMTSRFPIFVCFGISRRIESRQARRSFYIVRYENRGQLDFQSRLFFITVTSLSSIIMSTIPYLDCTQKPTFRVRKSFSIKDRFHSSIVRQIRRQLIVRVLPRPSVETRVTYFTRIRHVSKSSKNDYPILQISDFFDRFSSFVEFDGYQFTVIRFQITLHYFCNFKPIVNSCFLSFFTAIISATVFRVKNQV